MMHKLIDRAADWFIPEQLQQDMRTYVRLRMVVSGVLISWLLILPVLLLLEVLFYQSPPIQLFAAVIILGGMFVWFISLLSLRLFHNFTLCVHALVSTALFVILMAVLFTGGVYSPAMFAIVIPPVLAAIFTNKRIAFFWCLVSALSCMGVYVLDLYGIRFVNLVPEAVREFTMAFLGALSCFLVVGVLYIYEEITQKFHNLLQAEHKRFSDLAHHDDLTGLANRLHFNNTLAVALPKATETDTRVGLIYVDLDDFKPVNDNYGHDAGDQVLRISSQRMSRCVRMADTVARLGGDEFAVVLEGIESRDRLEDIVRMIEENMARPMEVFGQTLQIGASLGYSLYPDDAESAEALVQVADENMYTRKRARKTLPQLRRAQC